MSDEGMASVVAGAVVEHGGRVLLVRQTYGRLTGCWSLPTGFVEDGESPEAAAIRECREEAGVGVVVAGLLAVCSIRWRHGIQLYIVFLCHPRSGAPVPDGTETDRAEYLAVADLDTLGESVEPCCAALARRVLSGGHHVLRPADTSSWGAMYESAFH